MKRNLLLLAVMIWVAFGFSLANGAQDPNDNGVADTLYLEVWPDDVGIPFPDYPKDVKYALRVTNDIPDGVIDSIAGFVIPLCYTSTNAAANCAIDPNKNKCGAQDLGRAFHPVPFNLNLSVFQDLPSMEDPQELNWMMDLSDEYGPEWDTRIAAYGIYNGVVDSCRFSLVPTGTSDRRFKGGSRVLLATVKFTIDDSTNICVDTCFWPPTGRLAFSRSDAVTYIPQIWDDYAGTEWYCVEHYTIPDEPPYFTDGVDDQTHSKNQAYSTDDFTVVDDDGNIVSVTAAFVGTGVANVAVVLNAADSKTGHVEYDVTDHCAAGGTVTLTATDNAGGKGYDDFDIGLINNPPVCTEPDDYTGPYSVLFVSTPFTCTDPDLDPTTMTIIGVSPTPCASSPAIVGDHVEWAGDCCDVCISYVVTLQCTDDCGLSAAPQTFAVHFTNDPPWVDCPNDFIETSGKVIVLTEGVDYSMGDPEGGTLVKSFYFDRSIDGSAGFDNGTFTWTTTANDTGVFELCFVVVDPCGLADTCCFDVTLVSYGYSDVGFPPFCGVRDGCCLPCFNPGEFVKFPIMLNNETTPFGGFELAIEFDYTSMTFVSAELAYVGTDAYGCEGIVPLNFEKFTYRLLPCPLCGCCKYKILLYGQYDLPDGMPGAPIPMEEGALVYLNFVINNDQNLRGFMIPVCFEWEGTVVNDTLVEDWNCGENTFSSLSGDTLYVDQLPCRFWGDACEDDPGDRIQPVLTFAGHNCGENCGGILICDATPSTCKRGDVNYNTLTYEVADAVLFASYFVGGLSVFRYDVDYQVCATDVNADGRPLTLSDLVYMIRVILHDAVEIPDGKLTPSSDIANVIVYNGTISTECASPIGAILFEFDSAVEPTLLADMEMVHNGNKVLVWSSTGNSFSTAEVLSADAELVSVTAVDRDSRELETTITAKVAPSSFALHRAYPNPFNPFTNLSFNLPEAMSYSLRIYNVAGQLVRSYDGVGSQNLNVVVWDGRDEAGKEVSSGVYFYKLTAGGFSATEKMVMMK